MIREKINAAIQDMPENEEIKQLLSGSCKIHSGRSAGSTNAYQNTQHLEHNPLLAEVTTANEWMSLQKKLQYFVYFRCVTLTIKLVLHIVFAVKAHKCSCFVCFLIDRHSLLPLLADCGDPKGN